MTYGLEVYLHAFETSTVVEGVPLVKPNVVGGFCRGKKKLSGKWTSLHRYSAWSMNSILTEPSRLDHKISSGSVFTCVISDTCVWHCSRCQQLRYWQLTLKSQWSTQYILARQNGICKRLALDCVKRCKRRKKICCDSCVDPLI